MKAVHAGCRGVRRRAFLAVGQDRVVVAHEEHGRFEPLGAGFAHQLEAVREGHAFGHRHLVCTLDRRTIGQGVGKGNAELDHIAPTRFQGEQERHRQVAARVGGHDVGHEGRAALGLRLGKARAQSLGQGQASVAISRAKLVELKRT